MRKDSSRQLSGPGADEFQVVMQKDIGTRTLSCLEAVQMN